MAKLTRYLQKIFANNSNEVGVFGTGVDKETSKNVETLQSADYEEGWSSAIITNKNYPIWQEMDGVQYGLSYQLKYLFQNGIPEWLSTETYYTNSYCRYGSDVYYSLQDANTNHNPALNDGWWTPLLTSNRSIGEIVPSCIPLTDAGLHLLDGALIQGGGIYSDFVTYIADLYTNTKVYNPSAFTVVGSPNITDDGIASGFSDSNYMYLSSVLPTEAGHNYIFKTRYKHITNNFSETGYMFNVRTTSGNYFGAVARLSSKTISFVNSITGSTSFFDSVALVEGKIYDIAIETDFSTYAKYYIDGDLKQSSTYSATGYPITGDVNIGVAFANLPLTMGSIDLKQFSISVDGIQVFSGSNSAGFCLESEWQQSVTNYGVCGKFVYEPSSNTVRLPKITGILEGTTDISALGDLVEAGLPNITGSVGALCPNGVSASGAFGNLRQVAIQGHGGTAQPTYIVDFNASNSSNNLTSSIIITS
jgi:hypothetical protein